MLHEIGEKDFCCAYLPRAPIVGRDVVLSYRDNEVMFLDERLPRVGEVNVREGALQYLFSISEVAFYLTAPVAAKKKALHYESVRALRGLSPSWLAFAGMTGFHLSVWYQNNLYCGSCGAPLVHRADERALECLRCGRVIYPTINVAIIVGIVDGERILLSRYAAGAYRNYALVAGYVEIGETLEEAVQREVMEEVGLNVKNIRYYTSQPWGFSQALLVGFFADLDGAAEVQLEPRELSEAVWMRREEMPESDAAVSMTARMMEAFRLGEEV